MLTNNRLMYNKLYIHTIIIIIIIATCIYLIFIENYALKIKCI